MLGLGLGVDRGGFVPSLPLLDVYGGAAAAYSLRKLRTDYTGAAIRVRESATNTEADIGFSGGVLDTVALLAHTGANNGFVTTWYDQSGNAYNATQSTAANQPQIVSSGSVILENGKPTIDFDGIDNYLNVGAIGSSASKSVFGVSIASGALSKPQIGFMDGTEQFVPIISISEDLVTYRQGVVSTFTYNADTNSGTTLTSQVVYSAILTSSLLKGSINGFTASVVIPSFTFTHLRIGARGFGAWANYFDGNQQEMVIYASDQSSNRTAIEYNINAHYNIY